MEVVILPDSKRDGMKPVTLQAQAGGGAGGVNVVAGEAS
jgi:hypothetical protein